ncbi:hypothetical protein EJB05_14764, partial [Eragrostis curvula]
MMQDNENGVSNSGYENARNNRTRSVPQWTETRRGRVILIIASTVERVERIESPKTILVVLFRFKNSSWRLELIELYYDWPRGRNLNVVRGQLSAAGEPFYNVEWVNGSSYLFDAASCVATWHPVGILPPDWVDGAAYLGRDDVDGFDCHVWSYHPFFVTYYEDVATGRPVYWNFTGALRHVLSFETAGVPEVSSPKWQAPAHCFNGDNAADAANVAEDGADGEGTSSRSNNSVIRFNGAAT